MGTKGGKSNPEQYSQQQDEKGEQLECAHQGVEHKERSPGCSTRWGSLPALTPAQVGGRQGAFSGE